MTGPDPAAPGDDLDDVQTDRLVGILCRELPGRLRAALVGASDDPAYVRGLAAVGVGTVLDALIPPVAALVAGARADGAAEERERIQTRLLDLAVLRPNPLG
jgi:hypothetical protein